MGFMAAIPARSMRSLSLSNIWGACAKRRHHVVETYLVKLAQHRQSILGRSRAVIDGGDPSGNGGSTNPRTPLALSTFDCQRRAAKGWAPNATKG